MPFQPGNKLTARPLADTARPYRRATGSANGTHTHPERVRRGVKHRCAKLDDAKVQAIRAAGGRSWASLAREYGVSEPTIVAVVRRKTWRHVL